MSEMPCASRHRQAPALRRVRVDELNGNPWKYGGYRGCWRIQSWTGRRYGKLAVSSLRCFGRDRRKVSGLGELPVISIKRAKKSSAIDRQAVRAGFVVGAAASTRVSQPLPESAGRQ